MAEHLLNLDNLFFNKIIMISQNYGEIYESLNQLKFPLSKIHKENISNLCKYLIWIYSEIDHLDFKNSFFLTFLEKSQNFNQKSIDITTLIQPIGNKTIEVELFQNKNLDREFPLDSVRAILAGQISDLKYALESSEIDNLQNEISFMVGDWKILNDWENLSITTYLESGISGLIDHFGKDETKFNATAFACFLELGKYYE